MLRVLELDKLEIEDILWLEKALKNDPHEFAVENVLDRVANGDYTMFRFGEKQGIIVTEFRFFPKGKELATCWMAGEGMLKSFDMIMETLLGFAKLHGCRWHSAGTAKPGLAKVYSRYGKPQGTYFIREII